MSTLDPDDPQTSPIDPDERQTAIIAAVRVPPPGPLPSRGEDDASVSHDAPQDAPKPVVKKPGLVSPRVVVLRPDRVDDSYRSVHSALTRTTPRTILRAVGRGVTELLVTFGLVTILFAGYEIWGKTQVVDAHRQELDQQLSQEWGTDPDDPVVAPSSPPPASTPGAATTPPAKPTAPPPGNAVARMYIPRLDNYWVVVEGVQPNDLRYSPGHYPGTAKAGQVGNFSVAGHRIPAMFWDLDDMRPGDPIVLETAGTWYVYKVTQVLVTAPTAVEVVAPVPGQPGAKAVSAMLTITTCEPKWTNAKRLVVHAELSHQQPRSAGRPREVG